MKSATLFHCCAVALLAAAAVVEGTAGSGFPQHAAGWLGAVAGDLYVDPAHGADSNPGTAGQPFKTIAKARDTIRAAAGNLPSGLCSFFS